MIERPNGVETHCDSPLSSKRFLGTGGPFAADFNLVMQLIMGAALIAEVVFAKCKRYRAHGICQSTVMLVNLLMIAEPRRNGDARKCWK